MSATYPNSYDLRAADVKVLIDGLGYDDAQEFLKLWRGTLQYNIKTPEPPNLFQGYKIERFRRF
ncbi:hypothetical protein R80B4_03209 [Fibrobacteres bacterium R8-0-B4]